MTQEYQWATDYEEHETMLNELPPLPPADGELPLRVNVNDRSVFTDRLTGCRYVVLADGNLWFLWVDLSEYTGVRSVPPKFHDDRAFLPLDQGCRMTILPDEAVYWLWQDLARRPSGQWRPQWFRLSELWIDHIPSLKIEHGAPPEMVYDPQGKTYCMRAPVPGDLALLFKDRPDLRPYWLDANGWAPLFTRDATKAVAKRADSANEMLRTFEEIRKLHRPPLGRQYGSAFKPDVC